MSYNMAIVNTLFSRSSLITLFRKNRNGETGTRIGLKFPALLAGAFAALAVSTTAFAQTPLYTGAAGFSNPAAVAGTAPGSSPCCQSAYVLAATNDASNQLKVIAWSNTGSALNRIGSSYSSPAGGKVKAVAAAGLSQNQVVTADIDDTGTLYFHVWGIETSSLVPVEQEDNLASTPALKTSPVSLAVLSAASSATTFGQAATTFIDPSGNMRVQLWGIEQGGYAFPENYYVLGADTSPVITAINANQLVTAFSNSSGNLELVSWEINATTGTITRQQTLTTAIPASNLTIATAPLGGLLGSAYEVMTGFETSDSESEVISWTVSSSGTITMGQTGFIGVSGTCANMALAWAPSSLNPFVMCTSSLDPSSPIVSYLTSTSTGWTYASGSGYAWTTSATGLPTLAAIGTNGSTQGIFITAAPGAPSNLYLQVWEIPFI